MAANTRDLIELIKSCLREYAVQESVNLPPVTDETELFGEAGFLDSAGLVVLVIVLEEAIEQKLGAVVSLADERAMSESRSPFRSVASLAEYARQRIDEAEQDG
jgi:acyl carrier protein